MDEVTRRGAIKLAAAAGVVAAVGTAASAQDKPAADKEAGFRFKTEAARAANLAGPLGLATYMPVIYTGTAGGGADEYAASSNPNQPNHHALNMGVPAGKRIVATWYTLTHNIADLPGFALIHVTPNGQQVDLHVAAYPGAQRRVRITIYALYE